MLYILPNICFVCFHAQNWTEQQLTANDPSLVGEQQWHSINTFNIIFQRQENLFNIQRVESLTEFAGNIFFISASATPLYFICILHLKSVIKSLN